ncbi:hypothetical protein GGR95_002258 [Sulfitobacter undariae]|uniref:Heme degradation protein n=1 Tax=Sulfitobacter undariae TaxID=1563671 RepID=A0A7W6H0H8_9RHOB|nr:ChuX/HutX family heme-like substrate-binding protein [Sulfitobacter undariae]MBB3994610.1 hypothetical protein [Sulfitobacter undariae]
MAEQQNDVIALEKITGTDVATVLKTLPKMGKVMVIVQTGRGVTHERIGPVESVEVTADGVRLSGACHESVVDPNEIVAIHIDRSSVMRGKVFPTLKFTNEAGDVMFSVVGMEGTEPMDQALSAFETKPMEEVDVNRVGPVVDRGTAPEISDTDPAMVLFTQLSTMDAEVKITAQTPSLTQVWRGKVEAVKPSMGFVNVMTPDFHLHLKAGGIASWQEQAGLRIALNADGMPCGLTVEAAGLS